MALCGSSGRLIRGQRLISFVDATWLQSLYGAYLMIIEGYLLLALYK